MSGSDDTYRMLFDLESDAIFLIEDDTGRIREANPAAVALYGYTHEEFVSMRNVDVSAEPHETRRATVTGATQIPVRWHRKKDGTVFPVEITARHIDWHGRRAHIAAIRDITERQLNEAIMRRRELDWRTIFDAVHVLIWYQDREGRVVRCNRAVAEAMGRTAEELIGQTAFDLYPAEQAARFAADTRSVLETGQPKLDIIETFTTPGGVRWAQTDKIPYRDENGDIIGVIICALDITERMHAEQARIASEARWRALVESAPTIITTLDRSGHILSINRTESGGPPAERLLGSCVFDLLSPSEALIARAGLAQVFGSGEHCRIESEIAGPDGTATFYETHAGPVWQEGVIVAAVAVSLNTTERKHAEAALREAQKLESVGLLAGGIAHDFNNLLTGILAQASLALTQLPEDAAAREHVAKAAVAAHRAAELTRQLLAYVGKGQSVIETVSVNQLVRENMQLLETVLPKDVVVQLQLSEAQPLVEADRSLLHQVLMNMIINAGEAVGDAAGMVTVETGVEKPGPDGVPSGRMPVPVPESGIYAFLRVSDTGIGMDQSTMDRIFDPFYSTKFPGRGLGLAAVQGIVRSHRGGLQVTSRPGVGSVFTVYLPVSRAADATTGQEIRCPEPLVIATPDGNDALVLIIDDEAPIREAVCDILDMRGYRALQAANGNEGLRLFEEHHDEIGVVLLDLMMPVLGGEETLKRLRAIDRHVPIVLCSGYSDAEVHRRLDERDVTESPNSLLSKPYDAEGLLTTIHAVLQGSEPCSNYQK